MWSLIREKTFGSKHMVIKALELSSYRNYDRMCLALHEGTNIFYGDNAQGKTNILEAIYVCSTTKSHRGSKDKEVIQFEKEESHLKMILNRKGLDYRIDMHLKKNKPKGIAINGVPIRKASELLGIAHVIFFSPEDLGIIKNGPSERRHFIDMELCQLNPVYTSQLSSYNKVVLQRNKLLKDLSYKPETMDTLQIWDMQMVRYGTSIIRERRRFIDRLNEIITKVHDRLTEGKERLLIRYEPNVTEETFESALETGRDRDLRQKSTLNGPHRDDICFLVNGMDIRKFGSQGQQRTAALSLKLSEIRLVEEVAKDEPVLLLDDVLSELDSKRQNQLLSSISHIQTLITCTGLDDFVNGRFQMDKIFQVEHGTVACRN